MSLFNFLQLKCLEYQQLENRKDNLQTELKDVFEEQKRATSVLREKMFRADQQAEDLLGVDDEASDKFFQEKETLEKELKCLETEHSAVRNEFFNNFASCREELMTYPSQAFKQLEDTRVAFFESVKRSSKSGPGFSAETEELGQQVLLLNRAQKELKEDHQKQKEKDFQDFLAGKLGPDEMQSRETARDREQQEASLKFNEARLAYSSAKQAQADPLEMGISPKAPALEPIPNLQVPLSLPNHPSAAPEVANVTDLSSLPINANPGRNMGDETMAYEKAKKDLENAQKKHLEAAQKKKRKDQHEKPIMTGVTNSLSMALAHKLILDCQKKDTYSSLEKPVDPHLGDIYIYNCGAFQPLVPLDCTSWKLTHSDFRQSKELFGDRQFPQHTYVRTTKDEPQKKIMLAFEDNHAIVVHYR